MGKLATEGVKLSFYVPGKPAPAGSKRGFPMKRKDGSIGVGMAPASWRQKPYMATVTAVASQAAADEGLGEPIRGPVKLSVRLVFCRPKNHYGRNGLRPSAPEYKVTKPDALKCVRAIEDAMSGVIYADDSQVVEHSIVKRFGERDGAWITVVEL